MEPQRNLWIPLPQVSRGRGAVRMCSSQREREWQSKHVYRVKGKKKRLSEPTYLLTISPNRKLLVKA